MENVCVMDLNILMKVSLNVNLIAIIHAKENFGNNSKIALLMVKINVLNVMKVHIDNLHLIQENVNVSLFIMMIRMIMNYVQTVILNAIDVTVQILTIAQNVMTMCLLDILTIIQINVCVNGVIWIKKARVNA